MADTKTTRLLRALALVVGLGAGVGFLIGAFVVTALLALGSSVSFGERLAAAGIGGLFGAGIGAILAPAVGFFLLRHVSLGRAILWTGAGTLVGSIVGVVAGGAILAPILGFLAGAVALRIRAPVRRKLTPATRD
jgi:MFS family permease